jgi:hypothetical protein
MKQHQEWRHYSATTAALALAICLWAAGPVAAQEAKPKASGDKTPNVVVMLADNVGYGAAESGSR